MLELFSRQRRIEDLGGGLSGSLRDGSVPAQSRDGAPVGGLGEKSPEAEAFTLNYTAILYFFEHFGKVTQAFAVYVRVTSWSGHALFYRETSFRSTHRRWRLSRINFSIIDSVWRKGIGKTFGSAMNSTICTDVS